MGQLNEAIQIKNVLDFYDIKNFVETGTGQAEVVQTVVESRMDENNLFTLLGSRSVRSEKLWRTFHIVDSRL